MPGAEVSLGTHKKSLLVAMLLLALPAEALGWGAAMHAYVNYRALELARDKGRPLSGLDLRAYLAGAPGPDIWYATEEAKLPVPAGIEEDWEFVRLLLSECRDMRQLSWTLGYAAHIQGDVQGHRIYLSPKGIDAHHLIRDSSSAFVLYGAYEGYPHLEHDVNVTVGQGLDTTKGAGSQPGQWRWGGFDENKIDLMKNTVNSFSTLTFVGYHAEASRAAANAKLVKSYDDKEFGKGGGPAKLDLAMKKSIEETRDRVFFKDQMDTWMRASAAPADDVELLLEEEGGCEIGAGTEPWPGALLLLMLLWAQRRR